MPHVVDTWYDTAVAAATLPAYTRVKLDTSGQLAVAGATDRAVGYLTERGATSGQPATYRSVAAPSQIAIANAAIEVGDLLYAAADGEVDDVGTPGTTVEVGICTLAAGAGELTMFKPTDFIA